MKYINIPFEKLGRYEGARCTLLYYANLIFEPVVAYYLRTLFEVELERKSLLMVEKVPPELCGVALPSYAEYSIGEKGTLYLEKAFGEVIEEKLEIPEEQRVVSLKEVLPEETMDYSFESRTGIKSFKEELLQQKAVLLGRYLFPCSVIAGTFYFTSTRIVQHILNKTLDRTYYLLEKKQDSIYIALKPGYALTDASLIAFLTTDEYARKASNSMALQTTKARVAGYRGIPLYAIFPFYGTFRFKIRYQQAGEFFYVHQILSIEPDPLESLKVYIVRPKREYSEEELKKIPERIADEDIEELSTTAYRNKLYKIMGIRVKIEKERSKKPEVLKLKDKVVLSKTKHVYTQEGGEPAPAGATISEKQSKHSPYSGISIHRQQGKASIEEWNLQGFLYLVEMLAVYLRVSPQSGKPAPLPAKRQNRKKCSEKLFYDGDCQRPRKFTYACFAYQNKHILLVEIDRKGLKAGPSTYLVISGKPFDNPYRFSLMLLAMSFRLPDKQKLIDYFQKKYKANVHLKKHPSKATSRAVRAWCMRVKRIIEEY